MFEVPLKSQVWRQNIHCCSCAEKVRTKLDLNGLKSTLKRPFKTRSGPVWTCGWPWLKTFGTKFDQAALRPHSLLAGSMSQFMLVLKVASLPPLNCMVEIAPPLIRIHGVAQRICAPYAADIKLGFLTAKGSRIERESEATVQGSAKKWSPG